MLYLDSSAIVKLAMHEPETRALTAYLGATSDQVTSVLSAVEVPRAIRRATRSTRIRRLTEQVLSRLNLIPLDAPIRTRAATLEPSTVRALDAIHIACALDLGVEVTGFVTYDLRQAAAARGAGLNVVSPSD